MKKTKTQMLNTWKVFTRRFILARSVSGLYVTILLLFCSACGAKKQQMTEVVSGVAEKKLPSYFYIKDISWRQSSADSLYEFFGEIDLSPQGLSNSVLGEFFWSGPAEVFVSRGDLTVFGADLKERFTNETVVADIVICDRKLPIAFVSGGYSIALVNLKTGEVLNRYDLKGDLITLQRIANDEVLALVEGGAEMQYRYFFNNQGFIRLDSISTPRSRQPNVFSPDLKYQTYLDFTDLLIEEVGTLGKRRIPIGKEYATPIFGLEGKRIVLFQFAYNSTMKGKVQVFSFPDFQAIYEETFLGSKVISTYENRLVIGDQQGRVEVVDMMSGAIVYQAKRGRIRAAGLSEDHLVLAERIGTEMRYSTIDIKENHVLYEASSNQDFIVPRLIANNSKDFYFYFNDQVHVLDLSTKTVKEVPVKINHFLEARINKNDTKIAFKDYNLRKIGILDLNTYQVKYFNSADAIYFFGNHPDELIICTEDSSAVYNINTLSWSRSIDPIWFPRLNPNRDKCGWKNHLQREELVLQVGNSSSRDSIVHLKTDTYDLDKKASPIKLLDWNLIGLDRYANYYLANRNQELYRYDREMNKVTDTIPGAYHQVYSEMYATSGRDVLTTKQKDRFFLLSPNQPHRYQFLKNHDFIQVSPDLEYMVQTRADKIRVYRWLKD
ncbi:MAG: hypothetical protein KTR30_03005 [Saprospiraceae bacterium]|nr:hypothetical protein [Saprospiraceae bacterium]